MTTTLTVAPGQVLELFISEGGGSGGATDGPGGGGGGSTTIDPTDTTNRVIAGVASYASGTPTIGQTEGADGSIAITYDPTTDSCPTTPTTPTTPVEPVTPAVPAAVAVTPTFTG